MDYLTIHGSYLNMYLGGFHGEHLWQRRSGNSHSQVMGTLNALLVVNKLSEELNFIHFPEKIFI